MSARGIAAGLACGALLLLALPPRSFAQRRDAPVGRAASDSARRLEAQAEAANDEGTREGRERAVALVLRAADLHGRTPDRLREAQMLVSAAMLQIQLGRADSALGHAQAALGLIGGAESPARAKTLAVVGEAEQALGRTDSAIVHYRRALPVAERRQIRSLEGRLLSNIGSAFHQRGWADSAVVYLERALTIQRSNTERAGEARTLNNLGRVYQTLGRADSALTILRESLASRRELRDRLGEGTTLNNIAYSFDLLGRPDSALAYLHQALSTLLGAGQRSTAALTLINIGRVQLELGRPDSALAAVRRGLALKREVGDLTGQSWGLDDLGRVHAALNHPDSALASYREALALLRGMRDRSREGMTLFHLAALQHRRATGPDLRAASAYYDSAAAARGDVGAHAGSDADRLTFAEQDVGLFEEWVLAWLARESEVGTTAAAWAGLAVAERGRARALLDLMRTVPAAPAAVTTAALGRDLRAEGRAWAATVQRTGSAAALVYLVTRDTLVLWVVRPPNGIATVRTAVSRDTVTVRVRAARALLVADDRCDDAPASSAGPDPLALERLANLLLPPAARAALPPAGELLILPHGVLNLVPFAALPFAALPLGTVAPAASAASAAPAPLDAALDRVLGLRYALRYAPSFAALAEALARPGLGTGLERSAALRRALVVGNPRMPKVRFCDVEFTPSPLLGAERSSRAVARLLGVGPLIGDAATERAVRQRIAEATVVHLETHGFAYETDAQARASFVALAPDSGGGPGPGDGLLTVGEVLDDLPPLSAELVVLSACQTGLGNLKEAEGTVGLQRAFLAKRARSVLVSLWNVPDEATAALMEAFYRRWVTGQSADEAEALRQAEIEVRQIPRFAHPRYWAAFQLAGAG